MYITSEFQSLRPFGWPRIVLTVYGASFRENQISFKHFQVTEVHVNCCRPAIESVAPQKLEDCNENQEKTRENHPCPVFEKRLKEEEMGGSVHSEVQGSLFVLMLGSSLANLHPQVALFGSITAKWAHVGFQWLHFAKLFSTS